MTGIAKYKKTSVSTASGAQILVLLYDGFIRFTRAAVEALEERQVAKAGHAIGRALAIVHELTATLRPEAYPELCENLSGLYGFVERSLVAANHTQDVRPLHEALAVMTELRAAWSAANVRKAA